jgi:glycerol-3-phosphate O-acyltransferase
MINGETRDNSMAEVSWKIKNRFGQKSLGDIFVKYLEPINVKDFLSSRKQENLSYSQIE